MNELSIGDKVYMLANRYVPIGTIGTIVTKDYSMIPYEVLFDDGRRFWVPASCVKRAGTSPSQSSKRKLRIGDKVRIKSREWYEANKDVNGDVLAGSTWFNSQMADYCGKSLEIERIRDSSTERRYILKSAGPWFFSEEMFEEDYLKVGGDTMSGNIIATAVQKIKGFFEKDAPNITVPLIRQNQLLTNIKLD